MKFQQNSYAKKKKKKFVTKILQSNTQFKILISSFYFVQLAPPLSNIKNNFIIMAFFIKIFHSSFLFFDKNNFESYFRENKSVEDAIVGAKLEKCVADFIRSTFKIINTNKIHMIASSFALSRETLIPEMFLEILNQVESMLINIWYISVEIL